MILPCKTGQPEWVMRNALVLTALANFRVVGHSENGQLTRNRYCTQ